MGSTGGLQGGYTGGAGKRKGKVESGMLYFNLKIIFLKKKKNVGKHRVTHIYKY